MAHESKEATTLQDLLTQFVKLWNAADYDKLAESFDEDIVIKKLDDPGSVSGIGNVLVYFNKNQKAKKPQFNIVEAEPAIIWGNSTVAQISGTAEYQDKIQEPKTVPVRFTFTFCRASQDENWEVINAFQAMRRK